MPCRPWPLRRTSSASETLARSERCSCWPASCCLNPWDAAALSRLELTVVMAVSDGPDGPVTLCRDSGNGALRENFRCLPQATAASGCRPVVRPSERELHARARQDSPHLVADELFVLFVGEVVDGQVRLECRRELPRGAHVDARIWIDAH